GDGESGDAELHHRCIDDTFGSKLREQSVGGAKYAAEWSDVLTEDDDTLVALHLLTQRYADRFDDRQRTRRGLGRSRGARLLQRRHRRHCDDMTWPAQGRS